MSKQLSSEYLSSFRNKNKFSTPFFDGEISIIAINKFLYVEKQNILIKDNLIYNNSSSGQHLEFNFPISGSIELELNKRYIHSKGELDLFSFAAFKHKSSSIFTKKNQKIKQLSINLSDDYYYKDFELVKALIKGNTNLYKVSGENAFIKERVNTIYEMTVDDYIDKSEMEYLVYDLISYATNKIKENTPYYMSISKTDLTIIKQVREYINKNFLNKLTLAAISKMARSNEFKIKKSYKEVYGETIFETIRNKKMAHALNLIASNRYTFNEIAYLCGYESYPSFYKAFKKHFSFSPSSIKNIK